jgi:hypothetical protein
MLEGCFSEKRKKRDNETSRIMREHHREMTYLRQLMAYDETNERHTVEREIVQAERNERCVRRAVWLMAVLAGLSAVVLGYSAVLLEDYPQNVSRFFTHVSVKISCALGLASLISLLGFVAVWASYRKDLHERREECRRLAARVLESRLGRAGTMPSPGLGKEPEVPRQGSEPAVSE